jgi:hypothetical protein
LKSPYELLIEEIEKASEEGLTLEHAEKVAGQALFVMNSLSLKLTVADKDRRMRKRGLKAIKSAVRLEEVKKHDKKPTEGALEDAVNLNELVAGEEEAFDVSDISKEELERQFSIAKESHLYFRGVSRGRFE